MEFWFIGNLGQRRITGHAHAVIVNEEDKIPRVACNKKAKVTMYESEWATTKNVTCPKCLKILAKVNPQPPKDKPNPYVIDEEFVEKRILEMPRRTAEIMYEIAVDGIEHYAPEKQKAEYRTYIKVYDRMKQEGKFT